MENVFKFNFQSAINFNKARWLIRALILVSAVWTFVALYDMYGYMPWRRKMGKALEMAFLAHLFLWLATYEIKTRLRYLLVLPVIFSAALVYFYLWNRNMFTVVCAPMVLGWFLVSIVKGKQS